MIADNSFLFFIWKHFYCDLIFCISNFFLSSGIHAQNGQVCYVGTHVPWWFAVPIDPSSNFSPLTPQPPDIPPVDPKPPNRPRCMMCSSLCPCVNEWKHEVFGFLFLCQFAENNGFQLHLCPCKGLELIFLWLHSIPWCICATFSLSSLSLMGI